MGNVTQLVKPGTENKKETCVSKGWVGDDPYLFRNKRSQVGFGWFLIRRQRGPMLSPDACGTNH